MEEESENEASLSDNDFDIVEETDSEIFVLQLTNELQQLSKSNKDPELKILSNQKFSLLEIIQKISIRHWNWQFLKYQSNFRNIFLT